MGLGATAGAPSLLSLLARRASAQGVAAPKRLLVIYLPNCNQTRYWIPTGGAYPETGMGTATTYTLNKGNDAFALVKDRMTMIDGINISVNGGDLHSNAQIRFMTGKAAGAANLATVPSIDQLLLNGSPALAQPKFKSLELICDTRSDRNDLHHRIISYGMDSKPKPGENQPHLAFQRLFGSAPVSPGADPARALAGDKSVLDFLKADLDRLSRRIPTTERPKLDSHLAAIREIEGSLQPPVVVVGGATVPTGITALARDSSAVHDKIIDSHFKIIKGAFQFDLTRVVTFSYATGNSYVDLDQFLQSGTIKGMTHAITHEESGRDSSRILAICRWYTDRTAKFIQELAMTPDLDGTSSMLDNTVVVLFAETSQFHEHKNIPLVIFGGQKLGIPGNRVLHYKDRWSNDLWPTLSPIFGVDLPMFGDAALNKGKLQGLVV